MTTLPHVVMNSDKLWDPSKYDDFHVSVEDKLRQMPSTPIDVTDKFYDLTGDIAGNNHKIHHGEVLMDRGMLLTSPFKRQSVIILPLIIIRLRGGLQLVVPMTVDFYML